MKLSKLNVARIQLVTAINLFFKDQEQGLEQEQVSIHTLVCASHGILSDLANKNGLPSIMDFVKQEFRKEFRKKVREACNFFKHADTDSNEKLELHPFRNVYLITDAISLYGQLSNEFIIEFKLFTYWLECEHQEFFTILSDDLKPKFLDLLGTSDPIDVYKYFLDNREQLEHNKDLISSLMKSSKA